MVSTTCTLPHISIPTISWLTILSYIEDDDSVGRPSSSSVGSKIYKCSSSYESTLNWMPHCSVLFLMHHGRNRFPKVSCIRVGIGSPHLPKSVLSSKCDMDFIIDETIRGLVFHFSVEWSISVCFSKIIFSFSAVAFPLWQSQSVRTFTFNL